MSDWYVIVLYFAVLAVILSLFVLACKKRRKKDWKVLLFSSGGSCVLPLLVLILCDKLAEAGYGSDFALLAEILLSVLAIWAFAILFVVFVLTYTILKIKDKIQ